jgi:MFS family permease
LWLLVLSNFLFWGIGCYLILAHQVGFARDVGYSGVFAASVFALYGVFMLGGQFSSSISDWIGREKTITAGSILAAGGLTSLLFVTDTSQSWLLYLYAASFGFGAGIYSPAIFAAAADLFHGRDFGTVSALLLTGMGVGGFIGPWLGGYIHDTTGSYDNAFLLCIVCFIAACAACWVSAPRHAEQFRYKLETKARN